MKFKDLFKRKEEKGILATTSENIEILDTPKVIFEDIELQVAIGQWLDILPSQIVSGTSGFMVYTHFDASELMEKANITKDKLTEVERKFGMVLKMIGIDSSETCVLNQYDKNKFSFNCHFSNAGDHVSNVGDDAKISLRYGDMMDFDPELEITYHDSNKIYDYYHEYENRPMRMKLQSFTKKNSENGLKISRYVSEFSYYLSSYDGNNKIRIEVKYPLSLEERNWKPYFDTAKIEDLLLVTPFPIRIEDLYKTIKSLSFEEISNYPQFSVKIMRLENDKEKETTDMIVLKNGKLTEFITTINGEKISLDDIMNNWSFDTPEVLVSQDSKGKIDYSLKSIPRDQISGIMSPSEQINIAEQKVENVRQLAKTMFKN